MRPIGLQPTREVLCFQRSLTFNSSANPVTSAAISPDGKYLAYSDTAGIHVKLLSTGEERLIPTPVAMPAAAHSFVDSWFPDGTELLAHSKVPGGHGSMWRVSLMGQSPRALRSDAVGWAVSPDGGHIAFSPSRNPDGLREEGLREIWVMDEQGDNPQKVFGLGENEWLWSVHWSPNGRRLAYLRAQQQTPEGFQQWTETCDLKGANRTAVVVVSGSDPWVQKISWLPDGRLIYSQPESPGSRDAILWQIRIDTNTGTPISQQKRITQWAESSVEGLSASADGKRLVLQKMTSQDQVYLGQLAAGGTHMGSPRPLTKDEANDFPTAWTADSKAVIFLSDRNSRPDVFKQAINQDRAEPLVAGPKAASLARLSPDGRWLLYMETSWTPAAGHFPPYRLMRVPVNGGTPQFVLETRNYLGFHCSRAPASQCVILEASQNEKRLTLTAFDSLRGRGKVLRTMEANLSEGIFGNGLSPDGSTFAIVKKAETKGHISLLSLSGGSDREMSVRGWPIILNFDWAVDGKGFYCASPSPRGGTLLYVDLRGGAHVLWDDREATGNAFNFGIPSPDGRYLALGRSVNNSNVWMLEGF